MALRHAVRTNLSPPVVHLFPKPSKATTTGSAMGDLEAFKKQLAESIKDGQAAVDATVAAAMKQMATERESIVRDAAEKAAAAAAAERDVTLKAAVQAAESVARKEAQGAVDELAQKEGGISSAAAL